ncbi:MAG: RNA-binding S4 domain-containing protein [bacterium]|nr:RNA-binding S4 domain-containing protein [bacterium]
MKEITFELQTEFIPLIQLLKYTGIADSGADASFMVLNQEVLCNGLIELRKRYKVVKGDVIETADTRILIH